MVNFVNGWVYVLLGVFFLWCQFVGALVCAVQLRLLVPLPFLWAAGGDLDDRSLGAIRDDWFGSGGVRKAGCLVEELVLGPR